MFIAIRKNNLLQKATAVAVLFVLLAPATVRADGNTSPSLTGVNNETISICDDGFDPMAGVSATDADGDAVTITVGGDGDLADALSNDTPGTYTLSYEANDGNGGFDFVDRDITVEDDGCAGGGNAAPSLTGVSSSVTISICDSFDALAGVSATDPDGDTVTIDFNDDDLQDALSNDVPGTYVVTYIADDGNGGSDIVDRTVVVEDGTCGTGGPSGGNAAPSLTGVDNITISVCDSFSPMAGVSATDPDGDTPTITVIGDGALATALSNDTPGTYTLTYTADDGNGGFDIVDRDVTVVSASCGGGGGGGNDAPSISGATNVTISICDSFDALAGVITSDPNGDTVTLTVSGGSALADALSNDTPGTYTLSYEANDGNGGFDFVDRDITVIDADCGGSNGGGGNNGGGGGKCVNCGDDGGTSTPEPEDEPEEGPTPQVLGVTTSCSYLNDYLHRDFNNNPYEVMKLQAFLRVFEGHTQVQINGVFDQATFDAVEAFQIKYNDGVLNPWGYSDTHSTGYVYILTKKKVNEIFCDRQIALTSEQSQEINAYRYAYNTPVTTSSNTSSVDVPDTTDNNISLDDGSDGSITVSVDDDFDKGQNPFLHTAAAGFYSGINSLIDFLSSTCFLVFLFGILLGWLITEWYKGQKENKGHTV